MRCVVFATLAVLLVFTLRLPVGPVVRAEEFTCRGSLGATTVDNLRVPQNGTCSLNGTQVRGTIKVENGATLNALHVTVIGNVQAEGAAGVNLTAGSTNDSTVGGSIQIKQGGAAKVDNVRVNGDIQFESNSGALSATGNSVGGSVQVFQNTGGVLIADNTIDGNLQCKENNPTPTGGNNTVQGNKEDQCAQLESSVDEQTSETSVFVVVARLYLPLVMH